MTTNATTTKILFMCPHAAGKSLLAATYFSAAAARRELDVEVDLAGPDPDDHNMVNVARALEAQGFELRWNPQLVTSAHIDAAGTVVSIGCDPDSIPGDGPVIEWEVPMLSSDFSGAMNAIFERSEALAAEMAS